MGSCSVRSLICSRLLCPTQCGVAKQHARIFPTFPVSPHSLFPAISAITLFLFLLSLWHSSKQAASCLHAPLLITELQHRGDAGPAGSKGKSGCCKWGKPHISMNLVSSYCSLRKSLLRALSLQWSCSSLGVLIPFGFYAHNIKTEESYLHNANEGSTKGGRTDPNYCFSRSNKSHSYILLSLSFHQEKTNLYLESEVKNHFKNNQVKQRQRCF